MAQFDVHHNRGNHRDAIPYVVVVQSAIFDDYQRRVVIPLVKKSQLDQVSHSRFNPTFIIENTPVVLHPLEIVSIPKTKLGKRVQSLSAEGDKIIAALDELITRTSD